MATGLAATVYKHFEKITDPRTNRGCNHNLAEMIFVALTATLCGAQSWADVQRFGQSKIVWFRRHVPLPFGIPSHDTISRQTFGIVVMIMIT